jgi:hypothetical protein
MGRDQKCATTCKRLLGPALPLLNIPKCCAEHKRQQYESCDAGITTTVKVGSEPIPLKNPLNERVEARLEFGAALIFELFKRSD